MLSERTFLSLARGGGGEKAVEELRAIHRGRVLVLIRGLLDKAQEAGHPEAGMAANGFELLNSLRRAHPNLVNEILAYPTVTAWVRRTLTELREGRPSHPGRLACAAAVAAYRVGSDRAVVVPAENGAVVLPGLGRATLLDRATAEFGSGRVGHVTLSDGEPGWTPLRTLHARHDGIAVRFVIEDGDPDRMPGAGTVTGRLDDLAVRQWQDVLSEAWQSMASLHWTTATEVSAAITALTPLRTSGNGHVSGTPTHAFGNIGLSTPPGPLELAETLAHEVQHVKLSALLEIVPLTLRDDRPLHYAPWRPDPRPIAGLLQGTYAYLGVTGFWRRQREVERGNQALRAHSEFARWREAAGQAARTLADSERLTDMGMVFVEEMARTLRVWRREYVPPVAHRNARANADEHRSSWRSRHS
ncbi:HEXXH motif domain-containing protein [Spirillospora sp. NPDC048823]|uniref:HEXXH motif domain-containing protein n=1 Tax=unclassified Spirillospora TaxID=2642701 RepID=UPI00370FDA13